MDDRFERLKHLVASQIEELKVPGVAIGVLYDGATQTAGFGVTSVENPLAVDENTLFQIGSITKTFTATLAMQLVELGKLDLDAPIRTYLPDFRLKDETVAARVTLRHLFLHQGGWEGDHFADFGFGDDALARYVASMVELPQVLPLGETFSYNNAGFSLAGRVIEVVTGQPYEAVLTESLFRPLGMTRSIVSPVDALTYRFAVGHRITDDGVTVLRPWHLPRSVAPAGAIAASVTDVLRYARFQLGDGTAPDGARLLQTTTLRTMQSPHAAGIGEELRGIAWQIREIGGERVVGHGGGTHGQISLLTLVPARGFGLIVVTNADRGGQIADRVVKQALRDYLGIAEPEVDPRDLSAADVASYVGRYDTALAACTLDPREGGLVLQMQFKGGFPTKDSPAPPAPPPVRLVFYAPDRVIALDSPFRERGDFLRDAAGRIVYFRFGGRAARRTEG